MKRSLQRERLDKEPHLVWNAFVDLLAVESYDDLTARQKQAHLVFWYESEVQNGGHGQFLENRGETQLQPTVEALKALGLSEQAHVLSRLAERFAAEDSIGDWTEVIEDDLIEELDAAFHASSPTVMEALGLHLSANQEEYIEVT